ncbi:hypothetical protein [Nocardioides sp. Root140]|uniref:hypothetical protein n=1 Tax=Nocardioides sp. Root140 TaxID=1736460 RepID=UPI0012E36E07|nr:hypothetical protein [Nocardioides sp. Root140]
MRLRRATPSLVVVGATIVAVCLILITAQRAWSWQTEREVRAGEDDAIAAATAEVEGLINISSSTTDNELEKLMDGASANFRTEFEEQADRLLKELKRNKVRSTGEVVSAGVVSFDDDKATVLVAAKGSVQNKKAKKAEPRNYRLRVDLDHTDGDWLVSGLEFVA